MLNDFMPVTHRLALADHPDGITIIPLADAHYGSREFNETRWHQTIKRIQDDPHCFAVLVGDLMDTCTKDSVGSVYESTTTPAMQKEWLYNELMPIRDSILAGVGGNHERRITKSVSLDPLYDVMLLLGREKVYRANICFMALKLTYKSDGKDKQRYNFQFAITHGSGGGQYIGSSANKVQNFGMAIEGIDCLITGHTHKPVTFPVSKLFFCNGSVIQKQFVVAVASSFLDYGGYPVQKLLPPTAHTTTEIMVKYDREKQNIRVLQ